MRKARISIFVISAIAVTALLVGSIVILAGEEQEYNDYTNEVEELKIQFSESIASAKEQTEEAQVNGTSTYSLPENMSGWIAVPGTNIDYPLMTASDDFYLSHNPYGRRSSLGSIFYYNSQSLSGDNPNKNVVIYGHRISNSRMFGYLDVICRRGLINDPSQNTVVITTQDGVYYYEMFSAYFANISENFGRVNFANSKDFISYCKFLLNRSDTQKTSDVSFAATDRIITLVTCARGNNDDRRAVVHAKLVSFEPST